MSGAKGTTVKLEVTTIPTPILLGSLRRFWNTIMLAAHADVARPGRVPIDTGYLRNSLSPGGGVTGIDPATPPMWMAYGSNVPYGTYLEDRGNTNRYHYLDGPSKGQLTTGWLSQTIPNIQSEIDSALQEMASATQRAFKGAQ